MKEEMEFLQEIKQQPPYDRMLWLLMLIRQDINNITEDREDFKKTLPLRENLDLLYETFNSVIDFGDDFYEALGIEGFNFTSEPRYLTQRLFDEFDDDIPFDEEDDDE